MEKDCQQKIDLFQQQFKIEAQELLAEYEMLEPDNDYGWYFWMRRAQAFIIKQRLYDILKAEGAENPNLESGIENSEQNENN